MHARAKQFDQGPDDVSTALESQIGFDPYRAWLNVREVRRPLNAYQLLGLSPVEEDLETIRAAAGAKRAAMMAHRDEASPEVWEQVYGELEEAIAILLDNTKKAAYDTALQMPAEPFGPQVPPLMGAVADKGHGATLRCRYCRAPNPAARRYCANCGKNLWEPCFHCGTLSSAGERFCGACGANLSLTIQQQIEQFEAALAESDRMQAESRFDEAIELLGRIAKVDHPRLVDYANQANVMVRHLTAQRERHKTAADESMRRAEGRMAAADYEGAVAVLDDVPLPLRNAAIEALLADARDRLDEVNQLGLELEQAVQARSVDGLMPKIERLLTLKPDHAKAQQLARHLQDRVCRAALERLKKYQFDDAVRLLDQIPEGVRNLNAERLYAQATELALMQWDVRQAPVVDRPLLGIAERLAKVAAGDTRLAALVGEMKKRVERGPKIRYGGHITWAAAPDRTYLGFPVDWITGLQRFAFKPELEPTLFNERLGCFFTACGLALQGIGQSSIKVNLLPPDSRTMFGRVSGMMRMRAARSAWGFDISSSGLKALKLSWDERQNTVVIEDAAYFEHRKVLSQAVNEVEEDRILEETFKTFKSQCDSRADRICVGLSSRLLLFRQFALPFVEGSRLQSLVEYESRHQIPVPMEELIWDFQVLGNVGPGLRRDKHRKDDPEPVASRRELEVMVLAAKKAQVSRLIARLQANGLQADVIQGDALALHNWYNYEYRPDNGSGENAAVDGKSGVVLLDLGSDATNVVVCLPQLAWFRNIGLGGQSFTRALVQEFNLTYQQAEQLKRDPTKARRMTQFMNAIEPLLEDLVKEIRLSLTSFSKSRADHRVSKMLILGGGSQLHGLLRFLRHGR